MFKASAKQSSCSWPRQVGAWLLWRLRWRGTAAMALDQLLPRAPAHPARTRQASSSLTTGSSSSSSRGRTMQLLVHMASTAACQALVVRGMHTAAVGQHGPCQLGHPMQLDPAVLLLAHPCGHQPSTSDASREALGRTQPSAAHHVVLITAP